MGLSSRFGGVALFLLAFIVLILLGSGFWWWQQKEEVPRSGLPAAPKKGPPSLGAQIFERTENPTQDEFPKTNPFEAQTNPFDAKTNPFEDEYTNPF